MRSGEIAIGRQLAVVLDPGEDLFEALATACKEHDLRHGYIPVFLGAFTRAELIGTCTEIEDPWAPLKTSVELDNVEGSGCGTIAWDPARDDVHLHVHAGFGVKRHAALGYAGHLLSARTQYTVEVVIVEVTAPAWWRMPHPLVRDIPTLTFVTPPR
jgi:predicted DNA-binding protein with PD1-like motif